MRLNRIPVAVRLRLRLAALHERKDAAHHHPPGDNPYWACRECGIRDPELSIRDGRHFRGCPMQGIDRQIAHYAALLRAAEGSPQVEP
jgi:hypothetical protein